MNEVKLIEVVRLEPLDVIVIHAERRLTVEQAEKIRTEVGTRFQGHEVVIIAQGFRLEVVRPADE